MADKFDPNIAGLISGEFTSVALDEPGGFGEGSPGNLVINEDQPFSINVTWKMEGPLTPLWLAALGGNWSVSAYAESVGPGPELILKQDSVPVSSAVVNGTTRTWTHTLVVPAGTLQEENPGNPLGPSGIYRLAVTTFLDSTLGAPGYDIIGFFEGPAIKVENPI